MSHGGGGGVSLGVKVNTIMDDEYRGLISVTRMGGAVGVGVIMDHYTYDAATAWLNRSQAAELRDLLDRWLESGGGEQVT